MTRKRTPLVRSFLGVFAACALAGCSEGAADPSAPGAAGSTPGASGAGGVAGTTSVFPGGGGTVGTATGGVAGTVGGQVTTGGAASTGGAAGAGGAGNTGGANGLGPKGPSAGCLAEPTEDEPQAAVLHDLMVDNIAEKYKPQYVTRKFYTNLPLNYDPKKPYPTVFYGQGCGQTGPESGPFNSSELQSEVMYVQLIPASVSGDTVVPPNGAPGCFQAGKQGLADSPDGPYFDRVLAEVAQKYCIDTSKLYAAGWSSGGWLSHYLACARGNVLRAVAAGSGGLQHDHGECTGGAAVMVLPGDASDITEAGFPIGAETARDLFVTTNGCSATPTDMQLGNQTCQVHGGCESPVAWCPAGGGHGGPLQYIGPSGWAFWQGLQ